MLNLVLHIVKIILTLSITLLDYVLMCKKEYLLALN